MCPVDCRTRSRAVPAILSGMSLRFLDMRQPLLDGRFPLPLDAPFTTRQATACGIQTHELTRLVREGLLRRMLPGVYVAAQVPESLPLRAAALRLVVPPGAVVTDRTAGWLHGAERILAPGDHLVVPPLSVFHRTRGCRLRNGLTASGQRMLPDTDVMMVDGVLVTEPLRTACDLGRLLKRDQAFAALTMMLRLGLFSQDELVEAAQGFKRYRWVRQLRELAPMVDRRCESPGEAVLHLRWRDCEDLPIPEPQRPVRAPAGVYGGYYFVDLGVDELRFGAEYDGEQFHGDDRADHDDDRRSWITGEMGWTLRVVRKHNLRKGGDVTRLLRAGVAEARAALGNPRTFI